MECHGKSEDFWMNKVHAVFWTICENQEVISRNKLIKMALVSYIINLLPHEIADFVSKKKDDLAIFEFSKLVARQMDEYDNKHFQKNVKTAEPTESKVINEANDILNINPQQKLLEDKCSKENKTPIMYLSNTNKTLKELEVEDKKSTIQNDKIKNKPTIMKWKKTLRIIGAGKTKIPTCSKMKSIIPENGLLSKAIDLTAHTKLQKVSVFNDHPHLHNKSNLKQPEKLFSKPVHDWASDISDIDHFKQKSTTNRLPSDDAGYKDKTVVRNDKFRLKDNTHTKNIFKNKFQSESSDNKPLYFSSRPSNYSNNKSQGYFKGIKIRNHEKDVKKRFVSLSNEDRYSTCRGYNQKPSKKRYHENESIAEQMLRKFRRTGYMDLKRDKHVRNEIYNKSKYTWQRPNYRSNKNYHNNQKFHFNNDSSVKSNQETNYFSVVDRKFSLDDFEMSN